MSDCKMLLFDLDGTLLRSDKTISERTVSTLEKLKKTGIMLGISTSRGERNAEVFTEKLQPDIVISSGGALVRYNGEYIYRAEFSSEETRSIIETIRKVCGDGCEITADTVQRHYWNYKVDPKAQDKSWGDSVYTDFSDFNVCTLKICAEIFEDSKASRLRTILDWCDCIRFSDGFWYKLTRRGITKERAVMEVCSAANISPQNITAFGDDLADIGMLKACGTGIAMGNSVPEAKAAADIVIGSNDEDGIAEYLDNLIINTEFSVNL